MQLIPTVSQTPAGGTGSSRGPEPARRPRMLLGPCGRRRVDASGESAGCSAKAREKVQDRRRRMFLGCPQQLPRPAAPKAAHFTPQAATGHGLGAPSSPPQHPPCCFWGWGKKPKPPAARGLGSGRQRAAAPPARRCSSTFLGCTAGAGWGRAERRLLAAVRALPWTGADLLLQNINKRLQEREGNLARNLCRSWLVIEE